MKKSPCRKKGFTLIELLVVITIIGILAGIAIGPMGDILFNTSRSAAGENLGTAFDGVRNKNIADFKWPGKDTIGGPQDIAIWVVKEEPELSKTEIWFLPKDPARELFEEDEGAKIPEKISREKGSLDDVKEAFGYCVAVPSGLSKNFPDSASGEFPIMWTRGLESGQTEWSEDSPWEGEGGHVLYSNGDVEWYENTEGEDGEGVFKKFLEKGSDEQDSMTSDIKQAIPENWEILSPGS